MLSTTQAINVMNVSLKLIQIAIACCVFGASASAHTHQHDHDRSHGHSHDNAHKADTNQKTAANGYFADADVKDRSLSDWEGDWQSIYPLLQDGTLDPVMAHKAEQKKDKTADEYKQYYNAGYKTDIERLIIKDNTFTFYHGEKNYSAQYKYEGYKILTYKAGNRGVRYLFTKQHGDQQAPGFIQFSDHTIAPKKVSHFHIYFGNDDHQKLSEEMSNWPTYFPSKWKAEHIVHDLMFH